MSVFVWFVVSKTCNGDDILTHIYIYIYIQRLKNFDRQGGKTGLYSRTIILYGYRSVILCYKCVMVLPRWNDYYYFFFVIFHLPTGTPLGSHPPPPNGSNAPPEPSDLIDFFDFLFIQCSLILLFDYNIISIDTTIHDRPLE